ncbi:RagB/SusD family nutrient uptake outer membrane protein [Bacteroidota bacterium]
MKANVVFKTAILTAFVFIAGCAEDWLDEKPPQFISTESLYTTLAGFETGLNGLYQLVRQEREGGESARDDKGGSNQLRYELAATTTDNMTVNRVGSRFTLLATDWGALNSPENPELQDHFIWLYKVVNAANTIINNAQSRDDVDWRGEGLTPAENRNRVIGEARAIRAWAYRHLTYMWGDVPLSLQESLGSTIRTDWTRSPVAEVRSHIVNDLLFAEKNIPIEPSVPGKITRGAVQTYLAEMFLVLDKPDSALIFADRAINTPEYALITERFGVNSTKDGNPFADMFLDGNANRVEDKNTEALWVWQWGYFDQGGGRNIMRRWTGSEYHEHRITGDDSKSVKVLTITEERGGRSQSRFSMTNFALGLYEPQDDRFSHYIMRKFFILKDEVGNAPYAADNLPSGWAYGDTLWLDWKDRDIEYAGADFLPYRDWPYSIKFDGCNPDNVRSTESNKDQPYLRIAETYLLKAEAELELGNAGAAANTINVLRRRANASEITAGDVDIDFILDERSRELILEEHRRYTLLRTGKWLERTRLHNKNGGQNISDRDVLFPIPQVVIDANLTQPMPQNPGWN